MRRSSGAQTTDEGKRDFPTMSEPQQAPTGATSTVTTDNKDNKPVRAGLIIGILVMAAFVMILNETTLSNGV